jgi:putative (di)nucleoside polyphosphate hydrolase
MNGYRKNVAAIIINKDKKVLMCEHAWIDGAWQFPQGGVEKDESEEKAILRELFEEIGTKNFKVISEMKGYIKYVLPYNMRERFKFTGQEQKYFLLYFHGDDSEFRYDNQEKPEFKAFEWVEYEEPPKRVIYFKKLAYFEALGYFKEEVDKIDLSKL